MNTSDTEVQASESPHRGQDRFTTYRLLGHRFSDWANCRVPELTYRISMIPSRTISDSTYVRASLGNIWFLLPILGMVGGVAASHSTGGLPLPPTTFEFTALMTIGIFDAFAGFVGFMVFFAWVLLTGHFTSYHAASGVVGLGIMWFGGPQLAHTFRKVSTWDQEPTKAKRWWRIFGDVIVLSVVGGFLLGKMVSIMPYTTGYQVPIVNHETLITLVAIGAFAIRAISESLVVHNFRDRLEAMPEPHLEKQPLISTLLAFVVRTAAAFVVLWAFLGNQVATYIVLVLFLSFEWIASLGDRFPESTFFARVTPRNLFKLALVILVAELLLRALTPHFASTRIATGWIFVFLTLFTVLLLLLEQFKGKPWPEVWLVRFLGATSVVFFVLVLQGIVHV